MPLSPASVLLAMDSAAASAEHAETAPGALSPDEAESRSQASGQASQTAHEFLEHQLKLEAEARDVLPYSFDTCTKDMGPLRQNLFACLTCNPPPKNSTDSFTPAAVCYSCSISCHCEHELVELFTRRNFVCDCGTTRLPEATPCALRADSATGTKGRVHSEEPASTNTYNQNFRNRFCACGEWYEPLKQKGTMFQCIGLATEEEGGCGEDWWHPECLMGLPRDWHLQKGAGAEETQTGDKKPSSDQDGEGQPGAEHPVPPGFPDEDDFDTVVCYKCVETAPWIKQYANASKFIGLPKASGQQISLTTHGTHETGPTEATETPAEGHLESTASRKRSHEDDENGDAADGGQPTSKKSRVDGGHDAQGGPSEQPVDVVPAAASCRLNSLPPAPAGLMSILAPADFRERLCRCKEHYVQLRQHPQLLEEEETYEPPISEDGGGGGGADGPNGGGDGAGSVGTGSLLERGEAALSNMDRVRAIEGVMVYNHLKSRVKDFLKPFAESGQMVSAEDIKAYFEKLRGDEGAIRDARDAAAEDADADQDADHSRREQSGY